MKDNEDRFVAGGFVPYLKVPNAFRRLFKTTKGVEWRENQTPLSPLRLVVRGLLAACK